MKQTKRIISFLISITMAVSLCVGVEAGQAMTFSDVKTGDWFKPYIDTMSEKGICEGYGNGKYGPRDNLQVDQLIKLVVIALGYKPEGKQTGKGWAVEYITKAKELGLVKDGEYPDYSRKITRGEIARIIARGLKETFPENLDAYQSLIKDYHDFAASKDREYILKVYCKGIVNGYSDGRFGASDNATRGEASKMIVCLIDPSKRTTVDATKTEVVRGYTIPKVHTIAIQDDTNQCDIFLSLHFRYSLESQYSEIEDILSSKFGMEFAKKMINYAKNKKAVDYLLNEKLFTTKGYEAIVKGGGWTITFIVYKK